MALTNPKIAVILAAMFNLILIAILISKGKTKIAMGLTVLEVLIIAFSGYLD